MGVVDAAHSIDTDEVLAELQESLSLVFARARSFWKESAARIDPDLQPAGYKLLTVIARTGESNAHKLAEHLEVDKSVVSRQVRMLEELGFLESRPDARDGRLRVLTATAKASALLAEVRRENVHRLHGMVASLTPDEMLTAAKVFRVLADG